MNELTNIEFSANLRSMADMLESPENAENKVLPAIVRFLRKAADVIAEQVAENAAKDAEIARVMDLVYETAMQMCDYIDIMLERDRLESALARVTASLAAAEDCIDEIEYQNRKDSFNFIDTEIAWWRCQTGKAEPQEPTEQFEEFRKEN